MKLSLFNIIVPRKNDKNYLIFNSLTGNVISANNDIVKAIKTKNLDIISDKDKMFLHKHGILIDDGVNEHSIYSYWMQKSKFASSVVSATILLTHACNFRCTYCYEGAGEVFSDTMTKETASSICDFLINKSEESNSNFLSINLFGGEPLMNINIGFFILDKLSKYCKEKSKNLITSIITNGSLLTPKIIERLNYYNCKYIQITLDGPEHIHNTRRIGKNGEPTFQKVIDSIKLVDDLSNANQVVRINVDKTNLEYINSVLDILQNLNLKKSNIDFGIVRSSTDECSMYANNCLVEEEIGDSLAFLWEQSKKHGFKAGTRPMRKWLYCGLYNDLNYTFSPNGDMYKCWEMVGKEQHKMGVLNDVSEIEYTNAFWDWMKHNPLEITDCSICEYLPTCGGGCGVNSYNNYKTYHAKACFKVKGVIEKQILNLYDHDSNMSSVSTEQIS